MKYVIKETDNKFKLYLNDVDHIERYFQAGGKRPRIKDNNDNFIINGEDIYILSLEALNIEYIYAYIYYLSILNPAHEYANSEEYKTYYDKTFLAI